MVYLTPYHLHMIFIFFFLLWYWLVLVIDSNWKLYIFHKQFSIILQIFKLLTKINKCWNVDGENRHNIGRGHLRTLVFKFCFISFSGSEVSEFNLIDYIVSYFTILLSGTIKKLCKFFFFVDLYFSQLSQACIFGFM